MSQKDVSDYREDIAKIRELLAEKQERPILENWAFYTWSGTILAGTLASVFLRDYLESRVPGKELAVWIPLLAIACILEAIAWFRQIGKSELVIGSRRNAKIMGSLWLFFIAGFVLCLKVYPAIGPDPVFILSYLSIAMALLAQVSFGELFLESVVALAGAIVLLAFDIESPAVAGFASAALFFSAGIRTRKAIARGEAGTDRTR